MTIFELLFQSHFNRLPCSVCLRTPSSETVYLLALLCLSLNSFFKDILIAGSSCLSSNFFFRDILIAGSALFVFELLLQRHFDCWLCSVCLRTSFSKTFQLLTLRYLSSNSFFKDILIAGSLLCLSLNFFFKDTLSACLALFVSELLLQRNLISLPCSVCL